MCINAKRHVQIRETSLPGLATGPICLLHSSTAYFSVETCKASDSINNMAKEAWTKLKSKSLNWKGCDTFGNVHDTVDWELGPSGKYLHANST